MILELLQDNEPTVCRYLLHTALMLLQMALVIVCCQFSSRNSVLPVKVSVIFVLIYFLVLVSVLPIIF